MRAQTKYTAIEIIFDHYYGWFARDVTQDGTLEGTRIMQDWTYDPNTPESTIRNWATGFYCDPDGMTDAELQELRDIIKIRRGQKEGK